jgi:hypothetical protein
MKNWLLCLWYGHEWGEPAVSRRSFVLYDKWHGKIIGEGFDIITRKKCSRCGTIRKDVERGDEE